MDLPTTVTTTSMTAWGYRTRGPGGEDSATRAPVSFFDFDLARYP